MKTSIAAAAALGMTASALAVGTVNFDNFAVNAPVTDSAGNPAGSDVLAILLAGPPGGSLEPVGDPVEFLDVSPGVGFGYFFGGERRIERIPDGGAADVAVAAWEKTFGDYWAARALGDWYAVYYSPTLSLSATGNPNAEPPGTPVDLVGLQAFQMQYIPEPCTLALLGLGALALVLRLRR